MVISGQDPVILDEEKTGEVIVPYGSPLKLKCNLSTAGYERFWVVWYFNPSGPSLHDKHNISKKQRFTNSTDLVFNHKSSATDEDKGWYFCNVTAEIPEYKIITSKGTKVRISKYHLLQTNLGMLCFTCPYLKFLNSIPTCNKYLIAHYHSCIL